MGTTIWLSLVRAVLAVGVAVVLAWAITRTNVPGRTVFHNLIIIGFFMPLLPQIVAWSLLLSPRTGTLNVWLRALLGLEGNSGPFNIYSYEGIILRRRPGLVRLPVHVHLAGLPGGGRLAGRGRQDSGASSLQTARGSRCRCCCRPSSAPSGWPSSAWSSRSRPSCSWARRHSIYVFTTQIYSNT